MSGEISAVCDAAEPGGPGLHVEPVRGQLPPASQPAGTLPAEQGKHSASLLLTLEDSLQIYADKGMSYSIKGSLENLDIFQAIQLFLTPLCTVFSFAFTVPLVLKVSMLKYLEYLILILL